MNEYRPLGFRLLPPVVKQLLIINILLYFGTFAIANSFHQDLTQYLGLFYFQSEYFRPYQYITHLFMHGNFTHLFFNMFALWMFGNVIENIWGTKRFLIFYFVSGLGAAALLTFMNWISISSIQHAFVAYKNTPSPGSFSIFVSHYLPEYKTSIASFVQGWNKDAHNQGYIDYTFKFLNDRITEKMNIPTVGASGAVFGLLLAFGMMFPNSVIYLYFAIPIKAKYFVIMYGAVELLAGVMNEPGDNVAHFAHLGGMFFGLILILYWRHKRHHRYDY
jgi:membrane associated rhomboid family serine protease